MYRNNYPETKDEWWNLVYENWPDLLGILNLYVGMNDNEDINGNITLCKRGEEVERMRHSKDVRLASYINKAWRNVPDKSFIHNLPGWNLLCDLCSEDYVLLEPIYVFKFVKNWRGKHENIR